MFWHRKEHYFIENSRANPVVVYGFTGLVYDSDSLAIHNLNPAMSMFFSGPDVGDIMVKLRDILSKRGA